MPGSEAGRCGGVSGEDEMLQGTGNDGSQNIDAGNSNGAVYVYRRSGTTWVQEAYLSARKQQELLEVELNRAKIVMVDADGKMVRVPMLSEH